MRASLKDVSTGGVAVTIPIAGTEYVVALGPTRDLNGSITLGVDRLVAEALHIATQKVLGGTWSVPEVGTLTITEHVFASGLRADVSIPFADPLALVGTVTVDGALVERARLAALGAEVELKLALSHLELVTTEDRARRVAIDRVELHEVLLSTPWGNALVGQVVARGVVLGLSPAGDVELTCEQVEVDSVELKAPGVEAQLEAIGVTDLRLDGGRVSVDEITVGRVAADAAQLPVASWLPAELTAPRPPGPFVPPKLPDIPFLDDLRGRVSIDAFVDVGIPIIKSRAATHTVRQELIDGTIDFKKLEAGLSGLEDAVLDFEVKPGKLILEKDIPLIPWDNTTLVWWPLDAKEHAQAKAQQRVRLRRLLEYNLTDFVLNKLQPNAFAGKPLVTLRRIELNAIDIDVSLGGPSPLAFPFATLRFGAAGRPALQRARVTGTVKLAPGVATPPTKLSIALDNVCLGLERLGLFGLEASLGELTVEKVERLDVTFDGILPNGALLSAAAVTLKTMSVDGIPLPKLAF